MWYNIYKYIVIQCNNKKQQQQKQKQSYKQHSSNNESMKKHINFYRNQFLAHIQHALTTLYFFIDNNKQIILSFRLYENIE